MELCITGDAGRKIGRQGNGLVERIGMQRLCPAHDRGHGFEGGPGNVVEGILFGQAPAAGLAMSAQRQGACVGRIEPTHQLRPEPSRGPKLGDLHEIVHADTPKEGDARRELVDLQARLQAGPNVLQPIGQRVTQFDVGRRARFLHVVAGHADAVEARHFACRVGKDVAHDAHGWLRRVNVGVAHHVFLQNVILDGAGQLPVGHALFFGGDDVEGHDRQDRAVHRHGH